MDKVFEWEKLSPLQKDRVSWATKLFYKVQEDNYRKEVDLLKASNTYTTELDEKAKAKHSSYHPSEYSVLFKRLLDGDNPLDFPPPLVYGCPCHPLIESGFAMLVDYNGWRPQRDELGNIVSAGILIAKQLWQISNMNKAARKLVAFEKVNRLGESVFNFQWDRQLSAAKKEELSEIFNEKPEFVLVDRYWGLFKLYIGRKTMIGDWKAFDKVGVVSFSEVNTNPVTVSKDIDNDMATMEVDGWFIEHIDDTSNGPLH